MLSKPRRNASRKFIRVEDERRARAADRARDPARLGLYGPVDDDDDPHAA